MRKNKKQEDKKQMELDFQAVQQVQTIRTIESERLNKRWTKKSSSSKFNKKTYGSKPSDLLFDNLITVEELAVIFGLAPQTIRNWVAQGKLPYVKIGKRNLFLMRSVQEWLNRKEKSLWQ